NDRMSLRKAIAIALGLSGVVFISLSKGGSAADHPEFFVGVALLLLSNLIGGYTNIMVAKYRQKLSPALLTSFANFTGGLMLIVVGLITEDFPSQALPPVFFGALTWLAIIPAVGFSVWYTLLQKPGVKVSELNMWKFIIPVTGCVLSWVFLPGESPDLSSVAGIMIITIALQILQLPQRYFDKLQRALQNKR
ncbi:MAG: DMT family transporter, partial [Bacteroidales bacterium]